MVTALGLVLALGVSGLAFADGASDNVSRVSGKVKPKKLPKKKFKNVNLFTQVTTDFGDVPIGTQENAEEVYIDFGKNIKFKTGARPRCSANIEGTTTAQAKSACSGRSNLGSGRAHVLIPTGPPPSPPLDVRDLVVTVFNGSDLAGTNRLRLHAYSPTLGAGNTQVVQGRIVKAPGGAFGKRLAVPDAPDVAGDAGGLTLFNATIGKKTGVVKARCKAKRFRWRTTWVYDDGSKDTHAVSQKCKRKRKRR
jgi:hypothetical protein